MKEEKLMGKYSKSFKVQFSETDFTLKLKLYALVNKMQETSSLHAEELGMGYEELEKHKLGWIISKYRIHMDTYPKWEDTITIETWPSAKEKLFAMRSFRIYNQDQEQIGSIYSAYVLINTETGRPQRTTALPIELPVVISEGEQELIRFTIPKDPMSTCTRTVHYTDLDLNMHMNNACYVQWIEDSFPLEQHQTMKISDIQVNFISGATIGEEVVINVYKDQASVDRYYLQGNEKSGGREIFKARVEWETI